MSQNQALFNQSQLATWEEARECATKLGLGPIVVGNGVSPETNNTSTSGIYHPEWSGGPAGFPPPNYTDETTGTKYFFLHYRFRNGAEGMNVGLILSQFRRYPSSPIYVMMQLAAEAKMMAK